jgi:hypothetical protein
MKFLLLDPGSKIREKNNQNPVSRIGDPQHYCEDSLI